ncbi:unnamed protein product [Effrenium voratum]|nr:unnamed protein product [Effrenium voratum]
MLFLALFVSLPLAAVGSPRLLRHEISADGQSRALQPPLETIQLHQLPAVRGCSDCCNDGHDFVPCADVELCAKAWKKQSGRFALVFSYVGKMPATALPFLRSAKAAADLAEADLLLLLPEADAADVHPDMRRSLRDAGVETRLVNWTLPPKMKFTRKENWCGQKDLIRLHALGLDSYDAVAYFDNDIEFQGDIRPLLQCAAAGHFLTTNGGIGEALNVGFFAAKPRKELLQAAEDFASEASYSQESGWAREGWKPCGGYYVGGECGQGFFHTVFYKRQAALKERLLKVGEKFTALQVDKCVWNYQTSFQCKADFDCARVRVHHKPMKPGSDPHECLKRQYSSLRTQNQSLLHSGVKPVKQRFGFYFPVHDQIEGVVEVLKSARRFYPEAPIYVLQDGGSMDFGPLCRMARFNCTFQRASGENSRWNPHSWFARMRAATLALGTEYVIYLEPDVKITRRHTIDPKHDAGGVFDNFNPAMSAETKAYLERLGRERQPCFNVSWVHFGLCGGSYYRAAAVLDAFEAAQVLRIDWRGLRAKEGVDKAVSSDFAMLVALSARGYTVYPWEEAAQHFQDAPTEVAKLKEFRKKWPGCNESAAFQHNHKELYHAPMEDDERAAVQHFVDNAPDTTCHGCVWYEDGTPNTLAFIPSEPPEVEGELSFSYVGALLTSSPCTAHQRSEQADSLIDHPDYILNAGSNGLPLAEHQPSWLVKQDVLVVDARRQEKGGMLIVQPVFMEAGPLWGREDVASRPRWLRAILATNRFHARQHGHAMVIRWLPSKPQLLQWQQDQCGQLSVQECTKKNERENFNWEKHKLLEEYLQSSQNFSHVMMLDADAALVRDHDVLGKMAAELRAQRRDVFLTNEDWLLHGEKRINGGVILAKNSQWSKDLFRDTFEAHQQGPKGLQAWRIGIQDHQCSSNEQICLNDALGARNMSARVLLASGISYNRGGCTLKHCGEPVSDESMQEKGLQDERLEVLHFMGDHTMADKVLCDGPKDLTGDGPKGYGCSVSGSLLDSPLSVGQLREPAFLCC